MLSFMAIQEHATHKVMPRQPNIQNQMIHQESTSFFRNYSSEFSRMNHSMDQRQEAIPSSDNNNYDFDNSFKMWLVLKKFT